jgi:hypothetical protein
MKRRTLLGSAAMTLGGASVIGTGAFTSVEAERSISVDVVGDGSAFLQLEASPNCGNGGSSPRSSDFVYQKDGTIGINLTGDITDLNQEAGINGSRINGSGITKNSLWRFPNAFKIVNQGTQSVVIDFEVQEGSQEITISSPGKTQVGGEDRVFDSGDPAVVFYPGSNDAPRNLFNDEKNGLVLSPSDGQCIGFNVRTFGFTNNNNPLNNANLKITADATEVDEVENQPRAGLGISLSEIDGQSAGGKFNITGSVENNSSNGVGDITVGLEILNGNGVEVNPNGYNDKLIDDVGPDSDSDHEFTFENITLDNSGSYTARVTATADDDDINVAPVSDSVEFVVSSSFDRFSCSDVVANINDGGSMCNHDYSGSLGNELDGNVCLSGVDSEVDFSDTIDGFLYVEGSAVDVTAKGNVGGAVVLNQTEDEQDEHAESEFAINNNGGDGYTIDGDVCIKSVGSANVDLKNSTNIKRTLTIDSDGSVDVDIKKSASTGDIRIDADGAVDIDIKKSASTGDIRIDAGGAVGVNINNSASTGDIKIDAVDIDIKKSASTGDINRDASLDLEEITIDA